MIDIVKVSPFIQLAGLSVDVRKVAAELHEGENFNVETVKKILENQNLEEIKDADALNVFTIMCFFAEVVWSKDPQKPGYLFKGLHTPEEMVTVARTEGPSAGCGGLFLVPESAIQVGNWPEDDGWHIVARHVLNLVEDENE